MQSHNLRDYIHEIVDSLPELALPKAEVVLYGILQWEMALDAIRRMEPQIALALRKDVLREKAREVGDA